jgi:hypothetical protein
MPIFDASWPRSSGEASTLSRPCCATKARSAASCGSAAYAGGPCASSALTDVSVSTLMTACDGGKKGES